MKALCLPAVLLTAAAAVTGPAAAPSAGPPLLTYAVAQTAGSRDDFHRGRGLCASDLAGNTFRISDPRVDGGASWSPDGRRIAFLRQNPNNENGLSDLVVTDADGRNRRELVQAGEKLGPGRPVWAPDGSGLAFAWRGVEAGLTIFSFDGTYGGGVNTGYGGGIGDPSWSPDGRRLLFSMGAPSEPSGIYTIDRNGSNLHFLLAGAFDGVWSPDGRLFAYLVYLDGFGKTGLGIARTDGTDAHLLAQGKYYSAIAWSPDGLQIVYTQEPSAEPELELAQADGSGGRLLAKGADPAWSPDGSMIAFTTSPASSPRIALIRPDGTGMQTVDTDGLPALAPAWRPSAPLPSDRRPCVRRGTARGDVIHGTDRGDLIYGGNGADRIYGRGGDDLLIGGRGNDRLYGAGGDDVLSGGGGHDRLYGAGGLDFFRAKDEMRDFVFGGPGPDGAYADLWDRLRSVEWVQH